MAINGVIPSEFTQDQDWAVQNTQTGWFTLEWDQPIEVTQIIYYARVTSPLLECFKSYEVYLNDARVPANELPARLEELHTASKDNRMVLRADESASHGDVVSLIDTIKQSGFTRISLSARLAGAN